MPPEDPGTGEQPPCHVQTHCTWRAGQVFRRGVLPSGLTPLPETVPAVAVVGPDARRPVPLGVQQVSRGDDVELLAQAVTKHEAEPREQKTLLVMT
jgi:hypothetical protein